MSDEFSMVGGQDEPDGAGYSLVYPFVVCKSNGGPYDDDAFVAGARFGQIDAELRLSALLVHEHTVTVEPELIPQLELLAMHHGYKIRVEETEHPPWQYVTFELLTDDDFPDDERPATGEQR